MLKIGQFSRLTGVTIRTLRLYDRMRLLPAAYVAPGSGYRYYRSDQMTRLRHIRLLRELGCSLDEARFFLMCAMDSAEYLRALALLRKRAMLAMAIEESRLQQIDGLLLGLGRARGDHALPHIRQRRLAPLPVATLRDRVQWQGNRVQQMFEDTERKVARRGLRAQRRPFLLLHDMEYGQKLADVEVCVPVVSESLHSCGGRVIEGVDRAACARFRGSYLQAPLVYERLLEWMATHRTRIAGAVREVYVRFGADQRGYSLSSRLVAQSEQEYETELQIPVTAL
jgi:DNA-binding transcriptional MerR regulator